jgi:transposase
VWVWDNLNVHCTGELKAFIADNKQWLRVFSLPSYAPDLNPTERSFPQCELRRVLP